jgi:hypothetical protein
MNFKRKKKMEINDKFLYKNRKKTLYPEQLKAIKNMLLKIKIKVFLILILFNLITINVPNNIYC